MRPTALFLFTAFVGVALCGVAPVPSASRQDDDKARQQPKDKLPAAHADALKHIDDARKELVSVNQDVWAYAERGLEEHKPAARLVKTLKAAGFTVEEGV